MASIPTQPTSTKSALKCPSCNFVHHFKSLVAGTHFLQFNSAREIFGVTAECPVCLDECSGLMVLSCGHILCKDDYQRMGGVMPKSFDSATREKFACDIFLRRSNEPTTTLALTFRNAVGAAPPFGVGGLSGIEGNRASTIPPAPFPPAARWYGATTTTAATHSPTTSQLINEVQEEFHGALQILHFGGVNGAHQPVASPRPVRILNDPFSAFGEVFGSAFPGTSAGGLSSLSVRPVTHRSTSSAILAAAGSEARGTGVVAPPAATRGVYVFGAARSSSQQSATTSASSLNLAAGPSRMNITNAATQLRIIQQDAMRALQSNLTTPTPPAGEENSARHPFATAGGPSRSRSQEIQTLMSLSTSAADEANGFPSRRVTRSSASANAAPAAPRRSKRVKHHTPV